VKFASTGERLESFEPFHPDRMSSRILGMGDVLTLIEKAEETYEADQMAEMQEKMLTASFTLEDFLGQMRQLKKMGPLTSLLGMIPGMGAQLKGIDIDERDMKRAEAIILSMTSGERRDPSMIDGSRRARIARGCGMTTGDVNALLRQFAEAKKMMKAMTGGLGGMSRGALKGAMQGAGMGTIPKGPPPKQKPKERPNRPKQHAKKKKKRR
jgi:signal recognition particle subunit SRP54